MKNGQKITYIICFFLIATSAAYAANYSLDCLYYSDDGADPCLQNPTIDFVEWGNYDFYLYLPKEAQIKDASMTLQSEGILEPALYVRYDEYSAWEYEGNFTGEERINLTQKIIEALGDCEGNEEGSCYVYLFWESREDSNITVSNISLEYSYLRAANAQITYPEDGYETEGREIDIIFTFTDNQTGNSIEFQGASISVDGEKTIECDGNCSEYIYDDEETTEYAFTLENLSYGKHEYEITIDYSNDTYKSGPRTAKILGPIYPDWPIEGDSVSEPEDLQVWFYSYEETSGPHVTIGNGSTYPCEFNGYWGANWYYCDLDRETPEGRYNYTISGLVQNASYDSPTINFSVDYTSPSVWITYPENNSAIEKQVIDIDFLADDNFEISYCHLRADDEYIDEKDYENTDEVNDFFEYQPNQPGTYSFEVICEDKAGNEASSGTLFVEWVKPCIQLNSPITAPVYIDSNTSICTGNYVFDPASYQYTKLFILSGEGTRLDCKNSNFSSAQYGRYGIEANGANGAQIINCNFHDFDTGIYVRNLEGALIANNTVSELNLAEAPYYGIYLEKVNDSTITGNRIEDNYYAGIYAWKSHRNTFSKNSVKDTTRDSVFLDEATQNKVYENHIYNPSGYFSYDVNDYCYEGKENTYYGFTGPDCTHLTAPYSLSEIYGPASTKQTFESSSTKTFTLELPAYGNFISASMEISAEPYAKGEFRNQKFEDGTGSSLNYWPWFSSQSTVGTRTGGAYRMQDKYVEGQYSGMIQVYVKNCYNNVYRTQGITSQTLNQEGVNPDYISLSLYSDIQNNSRCVDGYLGIDETYRRYSRKIDLQMCDSTGCTAANLFDDTHDLNAGGPKDVLGGANYTYSGADGLTWGRFTVKWPAERKNGGYYVKISGFANKWGTSTCNCEVLHKFNFDDLCISDASGRCMQYTPDYPKNIEIDIGQDGTDYSLTGTLHTKTYTGSLSTTLNEIVSSCDCPGCSIYGLTCNVAVDVSSESRGILNVTNKIFYETVYQNAFILLPPTPENASNIRDESTEISFLLSGDADYAQISLGNETYPMNEGSSNVFYFSTEDSVYGETLPEGTYEYNFTATLKGMPKTSHTYSFTVDRTAPEILSMTPEEGAEFEYDDVIVSLNASEPISKALYRLEDTDTSVVGGTELTLYDLEKGNHTLTATIWDLAGNNNSASASFRILNDTTAPRITITDLKEYYGTQNPQFTVYVNEKAESITYSTDGAENIPVTSYSYGARSTEFNVTIYNLSEGAHNLTISATDYDNNTGRILVNYTVDTVAPQITIESPQNESILAQRNIALCYSASDENIISTCTLAFQETNHSVSPGAGNASYCLNQTLGSGNYSWETSCSDAAGNTKTQENTFSNQITVYADYDETTPWNASTIVVDHALIDIYADWNITSCVLEWEGVTYGMNASGSDCMRTMENLADATYTFNATVYSDIYEIILPKRTVTVYTVEPEINISNPQEGQTYNTKDLDVSYTVNSEISNAWYKLDSGSYYSAAGNFTLQNLSDMTHTLSIMVQTIYGKYGEENVSFTIDTTGPQILITSPAEGTEINTNQTTISFGLSEAASTVTLEINGVNQSYDPTQICDGLNCAKSLPLADGQYALKVYASDIYGNFASSPQRIFSVQYIGAGCSPPSSGDWIITGDCGVANKIYELYNRNVYVRNGANASFANVTFKMGAHGILRVENASFELKFGRYESQNNTLYADNANLSISGSVVTYDVDISISNSSKAIISTSTIIGRVKVSQSQAKLTGNYLLGVDAYDTDSVSINGNTIEGPLPYTSGFGVMLYNSKATISASTITGFYDVSTAPNVVSQGTCIELYKSSALISDTNAFDCSHAINTHLSCNVSVTDSSFANNSEFGYLSKVVANNTVFALLKGTNPTNTGDGVSDIRLINSTYSSIYGHRIYEYMPVNVKVVNGSAGPIEDVEARITDSTGATIYATPYFNGTSQRTNASGETGSILLMKKYRDNIGSHDVTNTITLYKNLTTFTDAFPRTIDASTARTQEYVADSGQWTIDGDVLLFAQNKQWSNNIIITSTGNLTIRYSTLTLNPPSEAAVGITVLSGGRLTIDHSTINSSNKNRYTIYAESGSNVTILDSNVDYCGCDPAKASCYNKYGLTIEGYASVQNTRITNGYYGLNLRAGKIVNDGNTIKDNFYGVYVTGAADAAINGDLIEKNAYGVVIESASGRALITNNEIRNNNVSGLYVRNAKPDVAGNTIDAGLESYGTGPYGAYAVLVNSSQDYVNLTENTIKGYGNKAGSAAIYAVNGAMLRITECNVSGGYYTDSSGIILNDSLIEIIDSRINGFRQRIICETYWFGDICENVSAGGKAIDSTGSNLLINGSTVRGGDAASGQNGNEALQSRNSNTTLESSTLTGGNAYSNSGNGGAAVILRYASNFNATDSAITGGYSTYNTAGTALKSYEHMIRIDIRNSTIEGGRGLNSDGIAVDVSNHWWVPGNTISISGSSLSSKNNYVLRFINSSGVFLSKNAIKHESTGTAVYVKDAPIISAQTQVMNFGEINGNSIINPSFASAGAGISIKNSAAGFHNNTVAGFYDGIVVDSSLGVSAGYNRVYANRNLAIKFVGPTAVDNFQNTYLGHYPPAEISNDAGSDANLAGPVHAAYRGKVPGNATQAYIRLTNISTFNGSKIKTLDADNLSDNYVLGVVRMRFEAESPASEITQARFYVVDESNTIHYVTSDSNPSDGIDFWWDTTNYEDIYYEVVAVALDARGYASMDSFRLAILKPKLRILSTSTINPTMIYTMSRTGNSSVQADRRYRAATVKINVTNNGTAAGNAIVKLAGLPAEISPQQSYLSIEPGETREVSFTFDPTYTKIEDGWWPANYSPSNNVLSINASTTSIMGALQDTKNVNVSLGLGPKFEVTSFNAYQTGGDGDDDDVHEACESYHVTMTLVNRGDSVWVTDFGLMESDGNKSGGDLYYYNDSLSPFLGFYGVWASGESRTRTVYVPTWLVDCNVNFTGDYRVYPYMHFYLPGDANHTGYYTSAVNRKLVSVVSFNKTLDPMEYSSGPMKFTQVGVDEDDVNLVLENAGDVYYEYGLRGYDQNAEWEQHWYTAMPPGTDATKTVKNARIRIGNSTTINYRYDVRYDWSLFFNELDGGLIVVDAAIDFMIDRAKVRDKLEKFGLDLSARDIVKAIVDTILVHYNTEDPDARGILSDLVTREETREWLLDRLINNVIGDSSITEFYDTVKDTVEFAEWLDDTGKTVEDFENEDDGGKLLMFTKYLASKLKDGFTEEFGDDIPFLESFIDLGEWFGTNLFSEKHIIMHVDIIDPPNEFNVYVSEQPLVFGSANNETNASGYGATNLTLEGDGNDRRESFYGSTVSPLSGNTMLAADIESITTILEGERVDGDMIGNVTILFKYKDAPNGTMIAVLQNELFAKTIIKEFFADLYSHEVNLTENNTLRYFGKGRFHMFAVSPYDSEIHTSVSSNGSGTVAQINSSGNYSEKQGDQTIFTASFSPMFGLPLEDMNLTVSMPGENTIANGVTGGNTITFTGIPEGGVEIVSSDGEPDTDNLAPKITYLYPTEDGGSLAPGGDIVYSIDEQHLNKVYYKFDSDGYGETEYSGAITTNGLSPGAHSITIKATDTFGYQSTETLNFVIEEEQSTSTTTTTSSTSSTTSTILPESMVYGHVHVNQVFVPHAQVTVECLENDESAAGVADERGYYRLNLSCPRYANISVSAESGYVVICITESHCREFVGGAGNVSDNISSEGYALVNVELTPYESPVTTSSTSTSTTETTSSTTTTTTSSTTTSTTSSTTSTVPEDTTTSSSTSSTSSSTSTTSTMEEKREESEETSTTSTTQAQQEQTTTSSTSSSSTTSTLEGAGATEGGGQSKESETCELTGDYPVCGEITLGEVIDIITLWSENEASLEDVIALISAWSAGA